MTTQEAKNTVAILTQEIAKLPASAARPHLKWKAMNEEICGVEIWIVNAKTGNRHLTVISDFAPENIPSILSGALATAKKTDAATLKTIASQNR